MEITLSCTNTEVNNMKKIIPAKMINFEKFNLCEEIRGLFEDINYFAVISADVDISNFSFTSRDYYKYPLGSDILYSDIEQFEDIKQAFAALFIKYIYDAYEWNDTATDAITKEEWERSIKEHFIPNVFYPTQYVKLKFEPIEVESFISDLDFYQVGGGALEQESKEIIDKLADAKVIVISETHTTKKLFGITENLVFLCEYGCYD